MLFFLTGMLLGKPRWGGGPPANELWQSLDLPDLPDSPDFPDFPDLPDLPEFPDFPARPT